MADPLEALLDRLGRRFDLGRLARAGADRGAIQTYYRVTRHAYSRWHDPGGAVHMGLSAGESFHPGDFEAQARFVESRLPAGARAVLELGTGRAMNALWLARRHPEIEVLGLDLTEAQLAYARADGADVPNFRAARGDFHDLSALAPGSVDLAFVVEALCHSADKPRVASEVVRVLRPGGLFIVIDGYRTRPEAACTPAENRALRLLARGMAVAAFQPYDAVRGALVRAGLEIVEEEDRSAQLMPSLRRHAARAERFVARRIAGWLARRVLPRPLVGTIVSGALFPALLERGLIAYWITVLRKAG